MTFVDTAYSLGTQIELFDLDVRPVETLKLKMWERKQFCWSHIFYWSVINLALPLSTLIVIHMRIN